ncbi:putative MPP superfamily phosphohydrolase [Bradyrhizobium japonicum USDA 38]|nr:putative MPP superfamily phosphohydrolase [Bradyrhizobium japonicum USDA 38]MCS3949870.1 putative MPP superfamily phosphohydrolase [Bradyrhizobium japonicum]
MGRRYRAACHTDQIWSEYIPQLIFGLVYLLILTRFIWPLQLPLSVKIVVAALALVALQFHRWSKLSSGSVFSPEFPRPVVAIFNWAFGALVLLALLQLMLDAGLLFGLLIHGGPLSAPDGVRYGLAGLASIAAATGVHQAMRIPPLKDVEVRMPGLPLQFDGYTILQLTDLHISRLFPASWARTVVERSNKLGVDLIAITGDLIDGTLEARRADIEPLRDLRAPDGVYVISGNHEYIFGYSTWMAHFAALGLLSLENRHIVLERNGGKLVLAGITDRASRHRGHPDRDLAAVLEGAPEGAPLILLDHQPGDARNAAALGVALQLSGHTHGGLILGLDRLAARANAGYVSGRYDVDGMMLYVNNGTALWPGFALRLGRPSELTRITLRQTSAT